MLFRFSKFFFFFLLLILLLSSCNRECRHKEMSGRTVSPSCGERGYTVFTCVDCSFSFESDFIPPSPHNMVSSLVAPTCTSAGYTLNECTICDYNYKSENTPIVDHLLVPTTIDPTCTVAGYTLNECSECEYQSIIDPTSPLSHKIKETKVLPTCEKEGYTTYSCESCSFSYKADYICALMHTFSEEITPPTCVLQGFTTKTCSVCSKQITTDYTDPTGHSYTTSTVRATSSSDGFTFNQCKKCDYSFNSDFEYSYAIFTGAYVNSSQPLAKGVDVSAYNGVLNWKTISDEGFDFAIIRAGSSKTGKDTYFEDNYSKARAAGLDIGVYYYVEATSVKEILDYADELNKLLKSKKFEYPVYLDFEKPELGEALGKELLTEMCCAFIEKLQSYGYFTAIYTNNNWLENFYEKDIITSKYDVWYARYLSTDKLDSPVWDLSKYGTTMGIWQYTDKGKIDGFDSPFDLNISYKDYPSIIKRYHYNGY